MILVCDKKPAEPESSVRLLFYKAEAQNLGHRAQDWACTEDPSPLPRGKCSDPSLQNSSHSWVWYPVPVTLALGKKRQEDHCEFEASSGYLVRLYFSTLTLPHLTKQKNHPQQNLPQSHTSPPPKKKHWQVQRKHGVP